jgi:hypothetical protein
VTPNAGTKLAAVTQWVACKQALISLGWRTGIAAATATAALQALGDTAPLDRLIFDALRRCPRPTIRQ